VLYFSFTSLSTVGFGDFSPRSDIERVACSFILLFGVAVFSYILGTFIEIIDTYNNFNKDPDEDENLNRFFSLWMFAYNYGHDIDSSLKKRIRQHFHYRWNHNKNFVIERDDDKQILNQLPMEVQTNIYAGFIYYDFLSAFEGIFYIEKEDHD
jgi:hypothetical protein